eukprot:4697856-Pleurochrysis_carterae.AAC.2
MALFGILYALCKTSNTLLLSSASSRYQTCYHQAGPYVCISKVSAADSDTATYTPRSSRQVGLFFSRYAKRQLALCPAELPPVRAMPLQEGDGRGGSWAPCVLVARHSSNRLGCIPHGNGAELL